ncbi:DNA double-strand break repair nuclease NurA [Caldivirga sp.]|uniref:DNA double-strand break repair nuclease NurA n=1 Tax=Caldivirga sp. TaxID=2080243 RepID=UPI003D150C8F
MDELFRFIELLAELRDRIGEFMSSEPLDLSDLYINVKCRELETRLITGDEVKDLKPMRLFGLDSQSSVIRFENADVYVVTGALVGEENLLVPGGVKARWLGLRLRFKVDESSVSDLENEASEYVLLKSSVLGRVFDGSYNEEAVRDEVRTEVEVKLTEAYRGMGVRDSLLLIDGPIFPTPRVLTMVGNPYADLYEDFIRRRVNAVNGVMAVGVVKRISQSTYYSRCKGFSIDDDTLIKNETVRQFGDRRFFTAMIGPLEITINEHTKYAWYVASRVGKEVNVVRVEAINEKLAEEGAMRLTAYMGMDGVPIPVSIADRLSRRLNVSLTRLLASLSPLRLTYEGLEELSRVMREGE